MFEQLCGLRTSSFRFSICSCHRGEKVPPLCDAALLALTQPWAEMFTSLTWSPSQVWSLEHGVGVKSRVFGHESESSLKSFNGLLKNPIQNPHVLKSSYLWCCFIGYRQNIWSTICFVTKQNRGIRGIVLPKMKILSSFTHPQVVPNQYEFICSAKHKRRYFEKFLTRLFWGTIAFLAGKKYYAPELLCFPHSSEYLHLCWAEQRHSNYLTAFSLLCELSL